MNRRFLLTAIMLMVGFAVADRMAGQISLTEFQENPPRLLHGDQRLSIYHPELFPDADYLRSVTYLGHYVSYFGVIHRFRTLDDQTVSCEQMLYWYWCEDGWQAVTNTP